MTVKRIICNKKYLTFPLQIFLLSNSTSRISGNPSNALRTVIILILFVSRMNFTPKFDVLSDRIPPGD